MILFVTDPICDRRWPGLCKFSLEFKEQVQELLFRQELFDLSVKSNSLGKSRKRVDIRFLELAESLHNPLCLSFLTRYPGRPPHPLLNHNPLCLSFLTRYPGSRCTI